MRQNTKAQGALNDFLWSTLERLRGPLPAESALNLFLQLLFYKFLDENSKDLIIAKEQWQLYFPEEWRLSNLKVLHDSGDSPDFLTKAMAAMEEANPKLLQGIFTQTDIRYFNKIYNKNWGQVILELISSLNAFNFERLFMQREEISLSAAFAYLLDRFAEFELKRSGFFITPNSLRSLLVNLNGAIVAPDETILDPNCGPGALLMDIVQHQEAESNLSPTVYGQERYITLFNIAKMQWIINGQDPNNIGLGDALQNPYLASTHQVKQFDKVVSCLPFNISGWGANWAANDKFRRFDWGMPPASKADYAHILHAIASLKPNGNAFLVSTAGVLFREGNEGRIRRKMIDENIVSSIIWLPAGLFNFWNIPLCVLCIDKSRNKERKGILMVNIGAYPESPRDKDGLNETTIATIARIFENYMRHDLVASEFETFCRIISAEEIAENDYNLNTARYIARKAIKSNIAPTILAADINQLENRLNVIDEEIKILRRQLNIAH